MTRLSQAFNGKKPLIGFITCGDPDLVTTIEVAKAMVAQGVGVIELGIPFSDPTAEGPVIEAANARALAAGTTTDKVFEMVVELRKAVDVPLLFMTYANVVFSYGTERFMQRAQAAGIDGLILPDVPYEERDEFLPQAQAHGLALVSFIAPTSEGRIERIARDAQGFIYLVSSLGVTGERESLQANLAATIKRIRAVTQTPVAVGFGISTPEQVCAVADVADGVIVGSAIVKRIAEHPHNAPQAVGDFVATLTAALPH